MPESIEILNSRLLDYYGKADDGRAIYRIVWANDQTEKRYGTFEDFTREGIYLRTVTEIREMPKYPYLKDLYVLENLVIVASQAQQKEIGLKVSYEPLFSFMDKAGFPLPPKWEACQWVISHMQAVRGQTSLKARYVDPLISNPAEENERRVNEIKEALFGNETDVGDALAHNEAIIVPKNYNKEIN